jgi:hypothetical protein
VGGCFNSFPLYPEPESEDEFFASPSEMLFAPVSAQHFIGAMEKEERVFFDVTSADGKKNCVLETPFGLST